MEIPLYIRPKLRYLCSLMKEHKSIPKHYQKFLDNDFIFRTKEKVNLMPSKDCCCNVNKYLEVKETDSMGKGVFAREDIKEGTYLGCYLGEYVLYIPCSSFEETMYYFSTAIHNYAVDGKNMLRYFNHSDDHNVDVLDVIHEGDIHNGFFANKEIKKGEQLYINYGDEYWKKAEVFGYFKYEENPYLENYYP